MGKLNLTMCWQYGIDSSTLAFEIIWARNGSWTLLSALVLHVFRSLTCQTDAHELQKCINCLIWRSYNRLLFCHSLYVDGDIVGRSACRYHLFHQSSDSVYILFKSIEATMACQHNVQYVHTDTACQLMWYIRLGSGSTTSHDVSFVVFLHIHSSPHHVSTSNPSYYELREIKVALKSIADRLELHGCFRSIERDSLWKHIFSVER